MSVRRRSWKNAKGEPQEAWIVDYVDQKGKRHIKTFQKKKAADAYHATVRVEVRQGIHTPDSASLTVEEAGKFWIKTAQANALERATVVDYRRMLGLHIALRIGRVRVPAKSWAGQCRMAKAIPFSLRSIRPKLKAGVDRLNNRP